MADDAQLPLPRSAQANVEDRMVALHDHLSAFEAATLFWLLNRAGWTCDKALAVRHRGLGVD